MSRDLEKENLAEPPAGTRRAPARRRRLFRRLGLTVLLVLLALFGILHTPPVQRLASRLLAHALSSAVGGHVTFASLNYRLWSGRVEVGGLRVVRPDLDLVCPRVWIDYTPWAGPRAHLSQPRLTVVLPLRASPAPPAGGGQPWRALFRLASLDVTRGEVRLQSRDGTRWLALESLAFKSRRARQLVNVSLDVVAAQAAIPSVRWPGPASLAVAATIADSTGTLSFSSVRLRVADALVEGAGEIVRMVPFTARLRAEVSAGPDLAAVWLPAPGLAGSVAGRIDLAIDGERPSGTVSLGGRSLRVQGAGPLDARVTARLQGRALSVERFDVAGYGGTLQGSGTLRFDDGPLQLSARLRSAEAAQLLRHVPHTVPLASRIDADISLRAPRWPVKSLGALAADAAVTLRPVQGRGIPLEGRARLRLASGELAILSSDLHARGARLAAEGHVTPAGEGSLAYALSLDDLPAVQALARDLGKALPALAVRGPLRASGRLTGPPSAWTATATVSSPGLAVEEVDVAVEASLSLSRDGIRLDSLDARGPDGSIRAAGDMPIGAGGTWNIEGEARGLRLDDLLATHRLPVAASLDGSFQVLGRADDPRLAFTFDSNAQPAGWTLPTSADDARARLRITGGASRAEVSIAELTGTVMGGSIAAQGSWGPATGAIAGRVEAKELRLGAPPGASGMAEVTSTLQASGEISGTLAAPAGKARVSASGSTWRGAALPPLVVDLLSADGTSVQVAGTAGGRRLLAGQFPLQSPWPLHLEADLGALPVADVLRAFPRIAAAGATLNLSGRAIVDVPLASPAGARFEARVESAAGNLVQPWQAAPFIVRGSLEEVALEGLHVRLEDGELRGAGTIGQDPATEPLTLRGTLPLRMLTAFVPLDEAAGTASLDLAVSGRLAAPSVSGSVRTSGSLLRLGALRLDDVAVESTLTRSALTVDNASARVGGGQVSARGSVTIDRAGGPSRLVLQARRVDVGRLASGAGDVSGLVDFEGTLSADRPAIDAVRGEGTLAAIDVSAAGGTFGLAAPVRWSVEAGRLAHSPMRLTGKGASLDLEVHADAAVPTIRLGAAGTIDLSVITPLLGGGAVLGGSTTLKGSVERSDVGWGVHGEASVAGGRLSLFEPALSVTDISATIRASGRRVDVVDGSAALGDGRIRFSGHAAAPPGGEIEAAAVLRADRVPLEFPAGLRSRSSGDLTLAGTSGRYRIGGSVVVHRANYELGTDLTARSLDQVAATLAAIEGRSPLRERVELDVGVRFEDALRVTNQQVAILIDGSVRAGGTLLAPDLSGALTIREGGTVTVSHARVRLQSGQLRLAGYPARQPEINLEGVTRVSGVNIDVALSGALDDLHTTLSSPNRSDLSQGDLASLILTGRTASAAGAESQAIVSEQVASALGRALDRNLGGFVSIDVSPDESLVALDADPSQRLNVRVPLSSWLAVIYSRSLEREALRWTVELKPATDLKVRAITDDDGSEAADLSHRFSLRLWAPAAKASAPRRPRVGTVRFEGVTATEESNLRSRMKLKPGAGFDYFQAEEAARKSLAWLASAGYPAASIDVAETGNGTAIDLAVNVHRGPAVTIEWRGDDPGRDLRKRIRKEWGSILPVEEYVARFAREATRTLQAKGYYGAAVSQELSRATDGRVAAVFDVRLGARGKGVDVRFEGRRGVAEKVLSAALPDRDTAEFFDLLAPEGHRRLSAALRVAYAGEGYLRATVGAPETVVVPSTNRLKVTIPIEEGPRAIVARLEVPDAVRKAPSGHAPDLQLRPGAPFELKGYASDRGRLLTWYRNEGYPDARVDGVLETGADGLGVRFLATPGPRVVVGTVRTAREVRTRPEVLDTAVVTRPGEAARARDLEESRERLSDSQAFRSVDVRLEPRAGEPGVRDVVVDVVERNGMNVEYGLRYVTGTDGEAGETPAESQAGFQVGAGVEFVSPFGWGHRYRFNVLQGAERRLLGARHDSATFFGRRWATQTSVFDDTSRVQDIAQLAQRVVGTTFQQTKRWRGPAARLQDRLRMQWGYTFKWIEYIDVETRQSAGGFRAGLLHTLSGDSRDSLTDPRRGLFWSLGTEVALRMLGSDVDYVRTYGQLFLYTPLGPKLVWVQAYRAGAAPGDDPFLLLENRFVAGGASTVRGFAESGLGPRTADGHAVGGQAILVFNQELRLPIWRRLWGGVFYDAGNVFALASDVKLGALRHSAGAGLRLMFPFGPIRFDWSAVLDPREGEARSRWLFSIGHAF